MTPEEIKNAVVAGVQEAIGELYIDRKQHYEDHEFVKGVRDGIDTGRKAGIIAIIGACVGAVGWILKGAWAYFTMKGN